MPSTSTPELATPGLTCVAPVGDWCGEAACWNADDGRLYWTDVNRFLTHSYDPGSGETRHWLWEEPVVALSLTDRTGVMLVGLGSRLVLWTPETDRREPHAFVYGAHPAARLNDGRAAPDGSFWIGSMAHNVGPGGEPLAVAAGLGELLRFAPGKTTPTVHKRGVGISNTVCWSPDETRFYFGDSLRNAIEVWDYDAATGAISNERPFFAGYERGGPDGSEIDAEGCLWNARWGGSCVVRVTPEGDVDRVVEIPALNVTTCAWGGEDLDTLFITSARVTTGDSDRLGGSLFALTDAGRGVPAYRVRL